MTGWRSRRTPRWSPIRFARQSALGHRRGQTFALVAVSALITACTAFTPVYDRAMQQALVVTLLAHASPADKTVIVQSESLVTAGGATDAQDPRDLQAMVPGDVAALLGPAVLGRTASVTPVAGAVPPTGPLVWREGACEHLRLLSGTCPAAPGEILVSEVDVETFDLALGSTPRVSTAIDGQPRVRLEVVGTYEPTDEAWWQGQKLVGISSISHGTDPSAAHDAWLTTEETFADGPILPGETSQSGAAVPAATTGVDELLTLDDRVDEMSDDVRANGRDLAVLTGLEDVTEDLRAQTRQAHRTVPLLMAPLAVLTVFVLWLVLAAATEQRRGEVAVARLRGRGPAGAVGLLLVELLPVLLLGVVPGAAAALLGGALARGLLPGAAPLEAGPGFAIAVLLAVAAVVVTTVAAAVRVAREPLDRTGAERTRLVATVGAGCARRLPDRRGRDRCPRLRHRQPQRALRPAGAGAPGAARRPAARSPRRPSREHDGSSTVASRQPRLRRDPARDGPAPGDPRGDRGDHRGQRARRLRPRRLRRGRPDAHQRERARCRGAGGAPPRRTRPRRTARGVARRRPQRTSGDARHGLRHHLGRGA